MTVFDHDNIIYVVEEKDNIRGVNKFCTEQRNTKPVDILFFFFFFLIWRRQAREGLGSGKHTMLKIAFLQTSKKKFLWKNFRHIRGPSKPFTSFPPKNSKHRWKDNFVKAITEEEAWRGQHRSRGRNGGKALRVSQMCCSKS